MLWARESALHARLSKVLPEWKTARPTGGLSLWVALPRPSVAALVVEAQKLKLIIAPGTRFGIDGAFERFVRLPYCLPEPELEKAVDTLAEAWARIGDRPARRARAPEPDVF